MQTILRRFVVLILSMCLLFAVTEGSAEFLFADERFRTDLITTELLDQIVQEYELYDGWYWTTEADTPQTFHGRKDAPGWTTTSFSLRRREYLDGMFGCRWPINQVRKAAPERGGYAECFAFAQFLGYLLSGEVNPQHNWDFYYSVKAAGGLKVGDIVRVEYKYQRKQYHHSAMVYSIDENQVTFLQVSGGNYNRISIGKGFSDGNHEDVRSEEDISHFHGLKISRWISPEE